MADKRYQLRDLQLDEISLVGEPANPGARVILLKSAKPKEIEKMDLEQLSKQLETLTAGLKTVSDGLATEKSAREAAEKSAAAAAARAEAVAKMTAEERAFMDALDDDEMKAKFAAADAAGRKSMMDQKAKKALDAGDVQALVAAAVTKAIEPVQEQNKLLQKQLDAANEREALAKAKAEAEAEFPNLPGSADEKAAALRALKSLPEERQATIRQLMKSGDAAVVMASTELGSSTPSPGSPDGKLDGLVKEYMAAHKGTTEPVAYSEVLKTAEGKALYAEHAAELRKRSN